MVGCKKVVIDSFRNTDNSHLKVVILCVAGELVDGIHRVVTAYVEEISDVVLFEYLEHCGISLGVTLGILKLSSAGAECRRRSKLECRQILTSLKSLGKINEPFGKEALDTVLHTVKRTDDPLLLCLERTADNTRERCVYCRGRAAGLANDSVTFE